MFLVKIAVCVMGVLISLAYIFPWIQYPILGLLILATGCSLAIESTWDELIEGSNGERVRTFARSLGYSFSREQMKKPLSNCFQDRLLVSKNVDPVIEQLIDNLIRDYILSWYLDLVKQKPGDGSEPPEDELRIGLRLKNETWIIVSRFLSRIRSIDEIEFFTKDLMSCLSDHVKQINECITPSGSSFYGSEEGATCCSTRSGNKFRLSPHLESEEKELAFLKKVSQLLTRVLVPKYYLAVSPLKHLLIEVITNSVLYRTIDLLSDPDYLNTKIIEVIKSTQEESNKNQSKTKYAFAETYDEFVDLIKKTNSVEELKRIRYFIVTEIMQATAINNLKRERGPAGHGLSTGNKKSSSVKGDHLLSRNLPRYINQLRYAKRLAEKQIVLHSSSEGTSTAEDSFPGLIPESTSKVGKLPAPKTIVSFSLIMSSDKSRKYFYAFLKNTLTIKSSLASEKSAHYLILYYESVNEMKSSQSTVKQIEIAHQLLTFNYYLTSINLHIKLPKEILKDMESFIMGNTPCPTSFYQTQKVVYKILEDRYYPAFIVSKEYDEMISNCSDEFNQIKEEQTRERLRERAPTRSSKDHRPSTSSMVESHVLVSSTESDNSAVPIIEEHISYSNQTLSNLRTSCASKLDALSALKHAADLSSKPTEATSKRIQKLADEVTEIKESIHEVDCHLNRSKLWMRYIGQWRAELYSIQPADAADDGNNSAIAAIIVHLGSLSSDMRCDAWVIARSVNEIINLKRKLIKYKSSLKRIEIYRLRNVRSGVRSSSHQSTSVLSATEDEEDAIIRKAKSSMNEFFKEILLDESTFKSEEVFLFFISSPAHLRLPITILRNPDQVKPSSSLPFASWLGFGGSDSSRDILSRQVSLRDDPMEGSSSSKISTDEELSKYFDELLEGKESLLKDDIAESAYNLLNEIFELKERGSLGWLRKSMIAFVQISFGSTINRQIHETASWLTSESMICYYLTSFRDSFWPPPSASSSEDCASSIKTTDGLNDVRSDDEKRQTYLVARSKVMGNIPDFLINLLGEQTTKKGTLKFFEMIQFKECNKQLLYNLLQVFLFRFIPELEKAKKS